MCFFIEEVVMSKKYSFPLVTKTQKLIYDSLRVSSLLSLITFKICCAAGLVPKYRILAFLSPKEVFLTCTEVSVTT
jgi:hypothetical protein